jgi:hypothetical protein
MRVYFESGYDTGFDMLRDFFEFEEEVMIPRNAHSLPEIRRWLEDNGEGAVGIIQMSGDYKKIKYRFEKSSDAVLFKLTWG